MKGHVMSSRQDNLVVGLDIGTTKICAIVGNLTEKVSISSGSAQPVTRPAQRGGDQY